MRSFYVCIYCNPKWILHMRGVVIYRWSLYYVYRCSYTVLGDLYGTQCRTEIYKINCTELHLCERPVLPPCHNSKLLVVTHQMWWSKRKIAREITHIRPLKPKSHSSPPPPPPLPRSPYVVYVTNASSILAQIAKLYVLRMCLCVFISVYLKRKTS